jgi:hypothetical protein
MGTGNAGLAEQGGTGRAALAAPEKRAYKAPALVQYGRLDRLTLGSGGSMLDLSAVDFSFINDIANCDAADGLTCFATGSL